MCKHLCRENWYIAEKPEWLEEYRVCLMDAANTSKLGSSGADYQLHYLIELFDLTMAEMRLTGAAEGETMTRYQKLKEKDLILGDCAYGTVKGIAYVREQKADYVFRLKASSFTLYTAEHGKFDLGKCLENKWAPRRLLEFHLYYKNGKDYCPVRVCALGKQRNKSKRALGKSKNPTTEKSVENSALCKLFLTVLWSSARPFPTAFRQRKFFSFTV